MPQSFPDTKPAPGPKRAPGRRPASNGLAAPTIYILLAAVAVMVQWGKWQTFHHTRNLVALVLSGLILGIAALYLLRAFRDQRQAGP